MKKIFKFLQSRYFLSALVILTEFILLLVVFILIYRHFPPMVFLSYIFYTGVFLYIINKYKTPEIKLPWVIILLILNVLGAYIFTILVGSKDAQDASKKYHKSRKSLLSDQNSNENLKKLHKENQDAYLQAKYLLDNAGMQCHTNNNVTYYELGEYFHKALLEELKKAKEYIFMEYFILEEGAMWDPIHEILKEKAQAGVKVYVLYDDFGCMTTLNERYYKRLTEEGINALPSNKFRPVLSSFHNNRDHRKITVIDGVVGFTGGINIADEYINVKEKHGHWKDTAIKIEGSAVQNLIVLFLETWNSQNKEELKLKDFIRKNSKKEEKGYIIPYGDGPEEFYDDNVAKCVYLNIIHSAKKYVYITTPYLICDYELLNALSLAAKKGIDVRIIVPHIGDKGFVHLMTQSNYETLVANGVKIYEYTPGFIHAKSFMCDDIIATCGTVNLDYRSLVHHFECGAWMYNTTCIKTMVEDFHNTLKKSEEISMKRAKLKGIKKVAAEVMKVFSPLM